MNEQIRDWVAIIGAGIAAVGLLVVPYLTAHFARPARKLSIRREIYFPAVLKDGVHGSEHLEIRYGGVIVRELDSARLTIRNVGRDVIESVPIVWRLDTAGHLLAAFATGLPLPNDALVANDEDKSVKLTIPYLNRSEELRLIAYCSDNIKSDQITARSNGVVVDAFDWKEEERRFLRASSIRALAKLAVVALIWLALVQILERLGWNLI